MAFNHKLVPVRGNDKRVSYTVMSDGKVIGEIVTVENGYTVKNGPPGTNIAYSSMKKARDAIDRLAKKFGV